MQVHLDSPAAHAWCDPLCFRIDGWLVADGPAPEAVEFWVDGRKIGETELLRPRPDVAAAQGVPETACLGFAHFGHIGDAARREPCRLEIRVRQPGRPEGELPVSREIRLLDRDYRKNHYGVLLDPTNVAVYRRENIYGSGPSQPGGDAEVLELLRRYLAPPPAKIRDVGCGLGWYGRQLIGNGYQWHGAEMKPDDCAELARQQLPHHQVDGRTLPFADGAFDAAMTLEVLEHTGDPRAFLTEIRRVAPRNLFVTVPNIELIPYLQDYQTVPWHLLEADHRNFFTRWSLGALLREFYPRVEIQCYHPLPLPAPEGTALYYHLFAVAREA